MTDETTTTTDRRPWSPAEVITRLETLGLRHRARLWKRLREDGWTADGVLAELNEGLQPHEAITRAELGLAVAEVVRRDVDQRPASRWPHSVILAAAVIAALALWYPSATFTPEPHLVAARDIPIYTRIVAEDVEVRPAAAGDDLAAKRQGLEGRYTTRVIAKGTRFTSELYADMSRIVDFASRRLVSLRVVPPDPGLAAALPAQVTLTAASQAGLVQCGDAWLLAVTRDAPAPTSLATIVLPSACPPEQLNPLLAAPAVALVWEPRPR